MRLGKEQAAGYVEDTSIHEDIVVQAPVGEEVTLGQPLTLAAEPVLPVS